MKRSIFILLVLVVVACLGGVLGSIFTIRYLNVEPSPYSSIDERQRLVLTSYALDTTYNVPDGLDFLAAARKVTSAVVHIRTGYGPGNFSLNPLLDYDRPIHSSGSGVIISDDGYIVTNNHVIEDATNIEVVMNNNQRYYAKLIGTDLSTDLALLKIKAKNLPFVPYGDSDNVQPGEWVLAIGNPFDLNSTVTAGIVSAKARNIGILREKNNNYQVEAFIQTDAAVNPGNSGGALVNLKGELIGVNTAIATSSGSYQGYSFAIPVTLVKKVMDDLLEYGEVKRGLLGIGIGDVDATIAETLHLPVSQGVFVRSVNAGSAAEQSGIQRGDIITEIDNHVVNSVSELQEWVARNRPGKEIQVTFLREGEKRSVKARLKNSEGNETLEKKEIQYQMDGARFENVPYRELAKLLLEGGVKLKNLGEGKWKKAGLKEGFVIGFIDKIPVDNVEDLNRILDYKKGGILVEGYYSDGKKGTYGVDW